MDELAPNLWRWTRRHPEWHPGGSAARSRRTRCSTTRGSCWSIPARRRGRPRAAELEAKASGNVRILITMGYHVRSSELVWERLGKRTPASTATPAVRPGSRTPRARPADGRRDDRRRHPPVHVRQPAAHRAPVRAAVAPRARVRRCGRRDGHGRAARVGVGLDAKPALVGRAVPADAAAARELDIERVLVTHGQPVLKGGAQALARAFDQPPWQR